MQRGDMVELDIIGQGMAGEGIARLEGIIVFVPYCLVGERVLAKLTFVKKNFINATAVKIIKKSPDRVVPGCPVYYKCGGCDLMHIDSNRHRELKEEALINNFRKNANMDVKLDEYVESSITTGYRNKVQLPFGTANGRIVVGYYVSKTHNIVPCDDCMLVGEWAHNLTKTVLDYANINQISVYNEIAEAGLLRHLVMRKLGDRVSIVIVINGKELPRVEKLINLLDGQPIKYDLFININTEQTNVILGHSYKLIKGNDYITCDIMNTKVEVSPDSFMQVNDEIRDKIYTRAAQLVKGSDVLIDLYSGVGITSNILAYAVKHVYSVEIVEDAVADARRVAEINGNLDKVTAICGDVALELPEIITEVKKTYGDKASIAVLLDPPRKGCEAQVMQTIAELAPDKIVYISCNHATLTRDIKIVMDTTNNAYTLDHLSAYDMFPNTHQLETIVSMTRK